MLTYITGHDNIQDDGGLDFVTPVVNYRLDRQFEFGWTFDTFQLTDAELGNADLNLPIDDEDINQRPLSESSVRTAIGLVYPDDFDDWELLEHDERTRAPIPHEPDTVFGKDDFGSKIFHAFLRRNNGRETINAFAKIFNESKAEYKEQVEYRIDHAECRQEVVKIFNEVFGGVVTEQAWTARFKNVLRVKSRYEVVNVNNDTRRKLLSWHSFPMDGNWRVQHLVLVEFHHVEVEDLLNLVRYIHDKKGRLFEIKTFNLAIDGIKAGTYYISV